MTRQLLLAKCLDYTDTWHYLAQEFAHNIQASAHYPYHYPYVTQSTLASSAQNVVHFTNCTALWHLQEKEQVINTGKNPTYQEVGRVNKKYL